MTQFFTLKLFVRHQEQCDGLNVGSNLPSFFDKTTFTITLVLCIGNFFISVQDSTLSHIDKERAIHSDTPLKTRCDFILRCEKKICLCWWIAFC